MNTLEILKKRKSVRNYTEKEVEKEKVEEIIHAAQHAPNAGPFHITVIRNKQMLKEINDRALAAMKNSGQDFMMQRAALPGYQPLYGAPVLFLLSASPDGYGHVNTACAATAMTYTATALELGSCYVVTPVMALGKESDILPSLHLPDGFVPMCGVLAGYPGDDTFATIRPGMDNVTYVD